MILKVARLGFPSLRTASRPVPSDRIKTKEAADRRQDRDDAGLNGVCSFVAYSSRHGDEVRSALAACVVQHGWSLLEVKPMALSLEDLFMRLVTKEERV